VEVYQKQNGVFHGVSLIFLRLKSILWIISGNMDAAINVKWTSFPQFGYGVFISAIYFR